MPTTTMSLDDFASYAGKLTPKTDTPEETIDVPPKALSDMKTEAGKGQNIIYNKRPIDVSGTTAKPKTQTYTLDEFANTFAPDYKAEGLGTAALRKASEFTPEEPQSRVLRYPEMEPREHIVDPTKPYIGYKPVGRALRPDKPVSDIGSLAVAADIPTQTVEMGLNTVFYNALRWYGKLSGDPDEISAKAAKEALPKIPEAFSTPFRKIMRELGYEDKYDKSNLNRAFKTISEMLTAGGEAVRKEHPGIQQEDLDMLNQGIMALGGARAARGARIDLPKFDRGPKEEPTVSQSGTSSDRMKWSTEHGKDISTEVKQPKQKAGPQTIEGEVLSKTTEPRPIGPEGQLPPVPKQLENLSPKLKGEVGAIDPDLLQKMGAASAVVAAGGWLYMHKDDVEKLGREELAQAGAIGSNIDPRIAFLAGSFIPVMKRDARVIEAKKLLRSGTSEDTVWKQKHVFETPEGVWWTEMSDKESKLGPGAQEARFVPGMVFPRGATMGEIFDHPRLYQEFPGLKDMPVEEVPSYANERGWFDEKKGLFGLRAGQADQVKSTTVHEIQHYIQSKAGSARGSSSDVFLTSEDRRFIRDASLDVAPLSAEIRQKTGNTQFNLRGALDALRQDKRGSAPKPEDWALIQELSKLPEFPDFVKRLENVIKADDLNKEAYEKYRRTGGEEMARAAQKRLHLSDEERWDRHPMKDFDAPMKDWILHFGELFRDSSKEQGGMWHPNAAEKLGLTKEQILEVDKTIKPDKIPEFVSSRLKQSGQIDPRLAKIGMGAVIGAAIGAWVDQNDPVIAGAIGALAGAFITHDRVKQNVAVEGFKSNMAKAIEQAIRKINPEIMGKKAKQTASILASSMVEMMRKQLMDGVKGEERERFWKKFSANDQKEFLKVLETPNAKFHDPEIQQLAEYYKKWMKEIYDADQARGIKYDPVDNYVFHIFEDPDGAVKWLESKYGTKFGDPSFTKDRQFQMIAEAELAGFKLKYTNPEQLARARQYASDLAYMRIDALHRLAENGLARRVKKETVARRNETEWRAPNGERFLLGDEANQIFKNAFESRSLWNDPGLAGMAYRGVSWMKNAVLPFKLWSLFHPMHVELGMSAGTTAVNELKLWAAGKQSLGRAMFQTGKSLTLTDAAARLRFLNRGFQPRGMRAFRGEIPEDQLTTFDRMQIQNALDGGFNPEMSAEYRNQHMKAFKDAIAERSATVLWHAPFAMMEMLWTHPVFENWIPAIKWEAYQKSASAQLAANPHLLENSLERGVALRKVAKMIDDRFGEMQYKTLFMDRMIKDVGTVSFLSYGWQLGFTRSYLGALPEAVQAFRGPDKITGPGSLKAKIARGDLDKTLFLSNYVMATMLYGGLMTYALTGDRPKEIMDYIFPRTGDKNPDGTDARVSTPFYTREFVSIPKHIRDEGVLGGTGTIVGNKITPAYGMLKGILSNKDFFNREISDPEAAVWKQAEQKLLWSLGEMEPMATSNIHRGQVLGPGGILKSIQEHPKQAILGTLGFPPAPKYATDPPEAHLIQRYLKYHYPAQTSFEQARKIEEKRASGEYKGPDLVKQFKILTASEQKKVLSQMDPETRAKYLPAAKRTVRQEVTQ